MKLRTRTSSVNQFSLWSEICRLYPCQNNSKPGTTLHFYMCRLTLQGNALLWSQFVLGWMQQNSNFGSSDRRLILPFLLELLSIILKDSLDHCPMPINADQNCGIDPNADQFRSLIGNDRYQSIIHRQWPALRGMSNQCQEFNWNWALIKGVLILVFSRYFFQPMHTPNSLPPVYAYSPILLLATHAYTCICS